MQRDDDGAAPVEAEPTLRYALIGAGAGIAQSHLDALARLPGTRVVGMSDVAPGRAQERAAAWGCPFFLDHRALLEQTRPDVAVICAPHPFHATLAQDSFAAGAHVLTEKPLAVAVDEADAMIAAAEAAGRLLAVNFQERFRPAMEFAKAFVAAGELGELVRVSCVEPWFRTAAYYRSATWRGTWTGEGGGVLMNQAPHTLDRMLWLTGSPASVWGWARTLAQAIETEDTAQALLDFPNGAPGYLEVSTTEAGSAPHLQLIGDRAALDFEGPALTIRRFSEPLSVFRGVVADGFATPEVHDERFAPPASSRWGEGHLAVHRDLRAAILEGRAPRCDGREALRSLELANAILLSSFEGRSVQLPLDRAAYRALLDELRAGRRRLPRGPLAPPLAGDAR